MRIIFKCPKCGGVHLAETWEDFNPQYSKENNELSKLGCPSCSTPINLKDLAIILDVSSELSSDESPPENYTFD